MDNIDCNELNKEVGKISPVSLSSVENQSPNSTPHITDELIKKNKTTKMTLGQTLKNELRKSSMQLGRQQKILNNSRNIIKPEVLSECNSAQESTEELDSSDELINENNCAERPNSIGQFFNLELGMAVCRYCDYKTKSAISSNLKMHLKTHHRNFFDKVFYKILKTF